MKSTFTKSARWIPSWTSSARPSRWKCSANRACSPRRWSKAPAGSTARTGVFPFPRRPRWRFWARAASRHPMRGTARTRHAHRRGVARGIRGKLRPDGKSGRGKNRLRPRHARQPDAAECLARRAGHAKPSQRHSKPSTINNQLSTNLDWETDPIAVLETNLDDCTGEILGAFVETALAAGALDVFHTPIQMKKNRPGVLLTVLCAEADADKFSRIDVARDDSVRRPQNHCRTPQAAPRIC